MPRCSSDGIKHFTTATLFCGAPVGVVGKTTVVMAGLPDSVEFVSLAASLGVFIAAGLWLFQGSKYSKARDLPSAGIPAGEVRH